MRIRYPSALVLTVALLLSTTEAAQAKCRQPLRVGAVVATTVVLDGVVLSSSLSTSLEEAGNLVELDPEAVRGGMIACWRLSLHGIDRSESGYVLNLTRLYATGDDDAGRPGGEVITPGDELAVIVLFTNAWAESMGISEDELVEVSLRKATPGLIALLTGEAPPAEPLAAR